MPGTHKGSQQQGTEMLRLVVIAGPGGAAKGQRFSWSSSVLLGIFYSFIFSIPSNFHILFFQVGTTSVLKNSQVTLCGSGD